MLNTTQVSADVFLNQEAPREIPPESMLLDGSELGPIIPGLQQSAVPQGLAYSNVYDLLFISYYFEDKQHPSAVAVIRRADGEAIQTLTLKEDDYTFHYGHVGGLAVHDDILWVASRDKVYQYDFRDFLDGAPQQSISPIQRFRPEAWASFSTYHDGILWIGEFVYQDSRYHSVPSHHTKNLADQPHYAWICGYGTSTLSDETPFPQYILSVRQKVQGIQWSKKHVFLSISWGRRNDSLIAVYRNPLNDPPHKQIPSENGETIPLWYLDETNLLEEIILPPLSEGITMVNGQLAILFESGAQKFQFGGRAPLDRLLLLNVNSYP